MTSENKTQHTFIMWFGQKYPEHRGLLFEVNNNVYSLHHASKRRSMGMVAGVADLILVLPNSGKIAGIELKAPGSTHNKDHIRQQVEWGKKVVDNGGFYYITSNIDSLCGVVERLLKGEKIYQNLDCISNKF